MDITLSTSGTSSKALLASHNDANSFSSKTDFPCNPNAIKAISVLPNSFLTFSQVTRASIVCGSSFITSSSMTIWGNLSAKSSYVEGKIRTAVCSGSIHSPSHFATDRIFPLNPVIRIRDNNIIIRVIRLELLRLCRINHILMK